MNEDYLNLSYILDKLLVACVNYCDPTCVHPYYLDDKKNVVSYLNYWLFAYSSSPTGRSRALRRLPGVW